MKDTTKPSHLVLKSSGYEQVFSSEKLAKSLHRAGASDHTIQRIVADIESWIFAGVTTKQIYRRAYVALHKMEKKSFRYRLKQAILELGPTGYPFEKLIGELYRRQGWDAEVGQVLQGQFITHEMDVIANKDKVQHLVECKYHKDQGKQVSIQVPLYVRSRVNDIIAYRQTKPEYQGFQFVGSVVTNTRFSEDSTQYGTNSGLKLLSWDFPEGQGLKELIELYHIYPITILKNLSSKDKQFMLNKKIVLCSELKEDDSILNEMHLSPRKLKMVRAELVDVCAKYDLACRNKNV